MTFKIVKCTVIQLCTGYCYLLVYVNMLQFKYVNNIYILYIKIYYSYIKCQLRKGANRSSFLGFSLLILVDFLIYMLSLHAVDVCIVHLLIVNFSNIVKKNENNICKNYKILKVIL